MRKIKKIFIIFCLLALTTVNAIAKEKQNDYKLGEKNFNLGKFEQSLIHFNKSLSQGSKSPALLYNLGSVHYKLKDYKTSKEYFLRLTKNKEFSALAYYNLGLIANKEEDTKAAVKHFKKSNRITKSKKLKKLSARQIATLTQKNKQKWNGYASVGYGYDSNITSAPAGIASNQSGSFMRASVLTSFIVSGTKTKGIVAKANVFATDYFDTSFNDDKSLAVDLGLRDRLNNWRLSYDAGIKQSTYGDDDFQRTYRLTFKAINKLGRKNALHLRYRYEDINSLSSRFDYLEGSRQKFRVGYQLKRIVDRIRLQYELELNDRNNLTLLTRDLNYSPTRHKFTIRYDNKLDSNNSVGGDFEYRTSDYDATATQNRSDDRISAAIKYTRRLDKNWRLKARVRYKDNDSNEAGSIFDYDRTITTLDLSRLF